MSGQVFRCSHSPARAVFSFRLFVPPLFCRVSMHDKEVANTGALPMGLALAFWQVLLQSLATCALLNVPA